MQQHRTYFIAALCALGACAALAQSAQDSKPLETSDVIGRVRTVQGPAFVVTAGDAVAAEVGTAVRQGSRLKTGANASLGVTFKDNTMMSFGPDTELVVDEYLYSPAEGQLSFGSQLLRGTLNYVSGVIAKLRPGGVTIKTPSGTIGVRGTQLLAKVNPPETQP